MTGPSQLILLHRYNIKVALAKSRVSTKIVWPRKPFVRFPTIKPTLFWITPLPIVPLLSTNHSVRPSKSQDYPGENKCETERKSSLCFLTNVCYWIKAFDKYNSGERRLSESWIPKRAHGLGTIIRATSTVRDIKQFTFLVVAFNGEKSSSRLDSCPTTSTRKLSEK